MLVRLPLSHHFWKNRENAQWFPANFPYPALEQEIKREYPVLASSRVPWKVMKGVTVFFDYRPEKDVYGRSIVPISMAFLPRCNDPAACARIILPLLAQTSNTATNLEVALPRRYLQEPRFSRKLVIAAILAFCLGGAGMTAVLKLRPGSSGTEDDSTSPPPSLAFETDAGKPVPAQSEAPAEEAGAAAKAEFSAGEPDAVAAETTEDEGRREICGYSDLIDKLVGCPKVYIWELCHNLQPPDSSFISWRQHHNDENGICRNHQYIEQNLHNGKYLVRPDQQFKGRELEMLRNALDLPKPASSRVSR